MAEREPVYLVVKIDPEDWPRARSLMHAAFKAAGVEWGDIPYRSESSFLPAGSFSTIQDTYESDMARVKRIAATRRSHQGEPVSPDVYGLYAWQFHVSRREAKRRLYRLAYYARATEEEKQFLTEHTDLIEEQAQAAATDYESNTKKKI